VAVEAEAVAEAAVEAGTGRRATVEAEAEAVVVVVVVAVAVDGGLPPVSPPFLGAIVARPCALDPLSFFISCQGSRL
jgi:hypothetical protein